MTNVNEMTVRDLVSAALERRPKAVLARALEVAPAMLSRWLSGASVPDERELETLRRIAAEPIEDAGQPPADDKVAETVSAPPDAPPAKGVDPDTGEPVKGKALKCEAAVKACSVSEKTVALGVEVIVLGPTLIIDTSATASTASGVTPSNSSSWSSPTLIRAATRDATSDESAASSAVDLDAVARYAGKTAQLEFRRTGPAGEEGSSEVSEGVFAQGGDA